MMTTVAFEWQGTQESPDGEAEYTVDGMSMKANLPDFRTANSIYFLLQRAERAGRLNALWEAKREFTVALNRMEAST